MGNVTIRYDAYDLLFHFNRNYASILYRFRDIASYLSKFADFNVPHLHLAPPLGVTLIEFHGDFWRQKTRLSALLYADLIMILPLAFLVLRLVTDRQTDGRTQAYSIMPR